MMLSALVPDHKIAAASDAEVTGLTADSRSVTPGTVFAAIKGVEANGQDYIPQAIEKGAVAVLSHKGLPALPIPYFASDNPRLAYASMAARLYPSQPETIVAMTGTNGKSSTVEFLRQIWAYAGLDAACFGTLGIVSNKGRAPLTHTTPDAVALQRTLDDLAGQGVTHCAMEASSHGLDQYRLDGVNVSAAGFTNLTQDHLDYHSDMEAYFLAKARLFLELAPTGAPAVINVDGEYGRRLADMSREHGLSVFTVGFTGEDISILDIDPVRTGQTLTLRISGDTHAIALPLTGDYQALNAVSAVGLAMATGVELKTALSALEHLQGVTGRMERVGATPDGAPVYVDFAHTADGLSQLLRSVRSHTDGQLVVVFGCGGDRDPDKRAKMGRIADDLADSVIVTDDNPRRENAASIRAAVMAGCPAATEIGDRARAIARGISLLGSEDSLVIAGKGHESGQIIGDKVIPFNDADVALAALEGLS